MILSTSDGPKGHLPRGSHGFSSTGGVPTMRKIVERDWSLFPSARKLASSCGVRESLMEVTFEEGKGASKESLLDKEEGQSIRV